MRTFPNSSEPKVSLLFNLTACYAGEGYKPVCDTTLINICTSNCTYLHLNCDIPVQNKFTFLLIARTFQLLQLNKDGRTKEEKVEK